MTEARTAAAPSASASAQPGILPHAGLRPSVRTGPLAGVYAGNVSSVFMRGLRVIAKSNWLIILTGFFEPVFYLASMGIGMGAIIGGVSFHGQEVPYGAYIAPALLATSAMNGALYDSTMNVFFKLKYGKVYDGMLATSLGPLDVTLGEIGLALFRGLLYAAGFLGILAMFGLLGSWTALLALPAVVLIAFGFAALGFAATSYVKTWPQLDLIWFAMLPMFLLSGTFFPLDVYPQWAQVVIQILPLWHGVDLLRQLTTGLIDASAWGHVAYFAGMAAIGVVVATRRIRDLFFR
ncbi:hypothetical protein USB125703_00969 [Pseudoclavibacter triregionum]|nr:hypothetical protein USB125703_00969 [Pseudoclavibacter triregionum]